MAEPWEGDPIVQPEAAAASAGKATDPWSGDPIVRTAPQSSPVRSAPAAVYVDPMTGAFFPQGETGTVGEALASGGRFAGGLAAGAASLPVGAAQLLAHGLEAVVPPQTKSPASQKIDAFNAWLLSKGSPEYDAGRMIGTYATPMAAAPLLPTGAALTGVGGALSRVGIGAVTGGAIGAATPVDNPGQDFWSQKAQQTGTGAVIGGAIPAAVAALRGVLPGPSEAVLAMRARGIEPTPGQVMGGIPRTVENMVGKIPIAGAPVQMGRQAAIEQFNRAAINDALAPLGDSLAEGTPVGHKAVAEMADKISAAYQRVVPRLSATVDPVLQSDLGEIKAAAGWLPKAHQEHLADIINNFVLGRVSRSGEMSGQAFQAADSALGSLATAGRASANAYDRATANAASQVQMALRDWLARSNPAVADELAAARAAFAKGLRVQTAASRLGGEPGVFSPEQLQGAVRQLDPSRLKGAFGRGQALMQEFADQASQTLSAPRQAGGHAQDVGAGIVGANIVEHLMSNPLHPLTYAGLAAYPVLRGLYSDIGRRLINSGLTAGQSAGRGIGSVPLAPLATQVGVRNYPGSLNPAVP